MFIPSSLLDDVKINTFTLSFADPLEAAFRDDYYEKNVRHVRIAALIAICFYGAFGILDSWMVPHIKHSFWVIRYAVFIPFTFCMFCFSFSRHFKKFMQASIAAVSAAAGLGIIAMILIAPAEIDSYYVGVILVFIYFYTFFKLRFVWAAATGWLLVIAYEIAVWLNQYPVTVLINHNFFFISSNIMGMFACYSIELYSRRDFLQAGMLAAEKLKVNNANRKLERTVRDRTGQLVNAVADLRNEIAEREQVQQALRVSEEKYRNIIETMEEGYFELDRAGNLSFFNDSLCRIAGYARSELMGMNYRAYSSKETAEKMYRVFSTVYQTGIPARILDYEIVKKNGETTFVEVSTSLMNDAAGDPAGFRGVARDVTERCQAEAALKKSKEAAEAASRAKSEFLANMSHELRTPLNHIMGFTELVATKCFGELNERQEEYLLDVLQSSNHLLSLINDLMDLAKIEEGRMEIRLSEVGVGSLMEQSVLMIKEKAMKHGLRVTIASDAPEAIHADERKLKQVIYNLLANAVKFTPDGGALSLQARHVAPETVASQLEPGGNVPGNGRGYIEFSVSDTGIGVKPEDRERIFNRFEQADGSPNRRYQGVGLGLTLSKHLVELHGGRIWVESEGEGQGAMFRFILPA